MRALEELAALLARDTRVPCPLSDLVAGPEMRRLGCLQRPDRQPAGGPHQHRGSRRAGGTPILSEIPEIFGAERLLMARAVDKSGLRRRRHDSSTTSNTISRPPDSAVSENPSPGNQAGGITTLEEKSLGAVQKAGEAPLTQVLRYGERVRRPGLALLEAPGNDAVSSTALAAAGATLLLFTTGAARRSDFRRRR